MNQRQIKNEAYNLIFNEVHNSLYFTRKGKIKRSLKSITHDNVYTDYDGNLIASFYLGSLINPSGKFYMPFAYSNVNECPVCHGLGHTKKQYTCEYCEGSGKRYLDEFRRKGYFNPLIDAIEGRTAVYTDEKGEYITCISCNGSGKVHHDCKYCGGLGSREAYEDSMFWEYLDNYASKHDGYIQSGEGDSTDTYLCFVVKSSDDME